LRPGKRGGDEGAGNGVARRRDGGFGKWCGKAGGRPRRWNPGKGWVKRGKIARRAWREEIFALSITPTAARRWRSRLIFRELKG